VAENRFPDLKSKSGRHCVSNETANFFKTDPFSLRDKFKLAGKRLQYCAFPQRDGSMLLRMTEASVSEPVKLRGNRRCRLVP